MLRELKCTRAQPRAVLDQTFLADPLERDYYVCFDSNGGSRYYRALRQRVADHPKKQGPVKLAAPWCLILQSVDHLNRDLP